MQNNKFTIVWVTKMFIDRSSDTASYIEMCKELEKMGNIIVLITSYQKIKKHFIHSHNIRHYLIKNYDIIILNSLIYYIKIFFLFIKIFIKCKPDVVLFEWSVWYVFLPLSLFRRVGLIKTMFCMDIRSVPVSAKGIQLFINLLNYKISIKVSKKIYQLLTVITPYLKNQIIKEYSFDHRRIGIWNSGVDIAHFKASKRKNNNKFVLLYHGVMALGRGIENLILSLNYVNIKNIELLLVGKNDIKEIIDKIISQNNLGKIVKILNKVDYKYIPQIISKCDVGVVPLPDHVWWRPSSPLKLLEYMSMGKPIILTDIPAHREIIKDNKCGFFAKSSNPIDIAEQITLAYELKENLQDIGKVGRDIVLRKYTWKIQANKLIEFINYNLYKNGK